MSSRSRVLLTAAFIPVAWLAARANRRRLDVQVQLPCSSKKKTKVGTTFDRILGKLAVIERKRERSEATWKAREARLVRLLTHIPTGIAEVSLQGRITYANTAAEQMLGARAGELIGQSYTNLPWHTSAQNGSVNSASQLPVASALRGVAVKGHEHTVAASNGQNVTLLLDIVPVRGVHGQIECALISIQNVNARSTLR